MHPENDTRCKLFASINFNKLSASSCLAIIILGGCSLNPNGETDALGVKSLNNKNYSGKKFETVLLSDPKNYKAHFLTALNYDRSSKSSKKYRDLAKVGYKLSFKYNPRFGRALYHIGLLDLEDRDFKSAVQNFLLAINADRVQSDFYYSLSYAALSSNRPYLAKLSFDKGSKIKIPDKMYEIALGALLSRVYPKEFKYRNFRGDFQKRFSENAYKKLDRDLERVDALRSSGALKLAISNRVFFESFKEILSYQKFTNNVSSKALSQIQKVAQANPFITGAASSNETSKSSSNMKEKAKIDKASDKPKRKKMAVVDVIIVQNDTSSGTSTGVNLLDLLSMNFQGKIVSGEWGRSNQWGASPAETLTRTLGSSLALEIPSITYSLNVANQNRSSSRLTARPSVLVTEGAESKIFSGAELTIVTDGQLNSSSLTKKVGLTLSVVPTFNDDGTTELKISTEQSMVSPITGGTFRQSLQTTSNQASLTAVLRSGETIMVAGGTAARSTGTVSQTPYLNTLPLMGNLFDKQTSSQGQTSLIVFLTLRKRINFFKKETDMISRKEKIDQEQYLQKLIKLLLYNKNDQNSRHPVITLRSDESPLLLDTKIYNPARDAAAIREYYEVYDPI